MIELQGIRKYITSDLNEDAKRPLIYPLFKKLFADKFKIESDAEGADTYIKGELLVELKSKYEQWIEGFYQALHYSKKGLSFTTVCVITKNFIGLWKFNDLPDFVRKHVAAADAQKAPNEIGNINARKTTKSEAIQILKTAFFRINIREYDDLFSHERSIDVDLFEFLKVLKNLDSNRIQINTYDFINHIESLKKFYDNPIDAVHCFYAIVGFWDVTSIVVDNDEDDSDVQVVSNKTGRISEQIRIKPKHKPEFKKFVESHYIFTNEGSGLTVDYYFSRFDEVISRINPEYAKQHGIFFTDINLSKFALWFVRENFEKNLSDRYIVFDPAGGSGNLVTSWRGHLKHKIVSELQPDLLRTIERRMRLTVQDDDELLQAGFTIIPRTADNKGLNFIDRSAKSYIDELKRVLAEKNMSLDKPIAFLLNPPYKNTDEKVEARENANAEYEIDKDILALTGEDAGKERYLAFLAQIINISKLQYAENSELKPLLMIFTPTSWLIPRPTYVGFRNEFDKHFKYENGFIITSKEFFKLDGKWPLAFTIWTYNYNEKGNNNNIRVKDFTYFEKKDLAINWNSTLEEIDKNLKPILRDSKSISLDNSKGDIRLLLPNIVTERGKSIRQTRYDYSVAKNENDFDKLVSGFPAKDIVDHFELRRKCGNSDGSYIGFMDDCTPVRIKQDSLNRMSNLPDRVWFRLDNDFKGINKTKVFNGAADNRSYCAYDLPSAKATFSWFAITKVLNGKYPVWANQYDIWAPKISKDKEQYFYSLCFAFALTENRCVVTRFEKDNPVVGASEVMVDNPLSPLNPDSFWNTTLQKEIVSQPSLAMDLVELIRNLYRTFASKYCQSGIIRNIGLHNEAYFRYFDYPDFLTPNSGLIQIRKYAELNNKEDLNEQFRLISEKTKEVKEEIYRLLVDEFRYFE
ncbi:MAG: hypothetical protein WC780_12835 [Lentimicrobiaceae bacterium]|jgi:hypothetical protein